ncbi:nucleoside triphosphate pyrophosphohydrolase family protein [Acetatifactor aquisgranensis]|uniref:hypothetical protein n=1 Tax=Acetatifactor aquisgranensis TaxID=2941233 RepID=UPI00203E54D9|nr:hypothetical protein [Acetatifactor aquisgranensis]
MTATEKKQRECLQKIINGDIPEMDISIRYETESVSGQQTPTCPQDVFRNAVQTWGKEAQTDMMIEEMADVRIMLAQMEIIFQNAGEVEQRFREKISRLDQRLQERRGGAAHE